ncbi:MAG TPA: protein-L-isoaspartate(D-aspartate) O-methyltransferase [Gammaproteobacteria bacterium]|nr:protein-L-isoaspartate(D-aspartate) O-methyltransferase [Gammaproteobacteria bacterium]
MNKEGIGMTSQRARDRLIQRLQDRGIKDMRVILAMRTVPRHLFIDEALASRAYEDDALPIDAGQTISQPYIVARMTELLLQGPIQRVLEVGTGSGYQAAILAQFVPEVYTMERIHVLYNRARILLKDLDYQNIRCRHSDGFRGWEGKAPFDAIIVTAAPKELPEALLQQLRVGGQLLLPWDRGGGQQYLHRVWRTENGYESGDLEPVVFVPMLHGAVR